MPGDVGVIVVRPADPLWEALSPEVLERVNSLLPAGLYPDEFVTRTGLSGAKASSRAIALFLWVAAEGHGHIWVDAFLGGRVVDSFRLRDGWPLQYGDEHRYGLRLSLSRPARFEREESA